MKKRFRSILAHAAIFIFSVAAFNADAQFTSSQEYFDQFYRMPVAELIEAVEQDPTNRVFIQRLSDISIKGDARVLSVLRKAFDRVTDKTDKQIIASALVWLGEREERYAAFLLQHARNAIENNAPYPLLFDENGKTILGQLNPKFRAWCRTHKHDQLSKEYEALYEYPSAVMALAHAAYPKARNIFRKGLKAKNPLIAARSAEGLVILEDYESIFLIIERCKKAPQEVAEIIATALVFFDDPRAQRAAEQFLVNTPIFESLRKAAQTKSIPVRNQIRSIQ